MGTSDFLFHLLNFFAPVFGVAVLLTAASGLLLRPSARSGSFWTRCAINAGAGSLAWVAALVLLGRDGKMMAYLALTLALASSEWWQTGGFRK